MSLLLILLAVAHLARAGVGEGQSCKDEFLLSVANNTDGLEIILFARDDEQLGRTGETFVDLSLQGQFLSPECGEQSFRCADLVKLSVGTSQHIVFVPLLHGLLVLDIRYDGTEMKFEGHFIIEVEICSPTAVVEIFESVYTICVNQSTKRLKLYEIHLDTDTISNTYLSTALADVSLTDPPNLSNFVYASLNQDSHSQRIYFTTSNNLYELIPISVGYSRIGDVDPRNSEESCNSVESLEYQEWTLLAYCEDNVVIYFDLEEEEVTNTENSEDDGRPYLCPNPHIDLRVFSSGSYIEFGFEESNSKEFYELPGSAYHSGLCFGTENSSFLAYTDSQDGVYVFDLQTSKHLPLSSMPCPASGCKPLLVTDNNYLVIQEEDGIIVIDREKNFSQIITARHIKADLLTVIVRGYQCPSELSPSLTPAMNPETEYRQENDVVKTVASTVGVVIVVIIGFALAAVVLIYAVKRKNSHRHPTEETGEGPHTETYTVIKNIALSPPVTQLQGAKNCSHNGEHSNSAPASSSSATTESSPAAKHMYKSASLELKNIKPDLSSSHECHSTPVTETFGNSELEHGRLNLPKTTTQIKETRV